MLEVMLHSFSDVKRGAEQCVQKPEVEEEIRDKDMGSNGFYLRQDFFLVAFTFDSQCIQFAPYFQVNKLAKKDVIG